MSQKDNIYQSKLETVSKFTFDSKVADVFDDMIQRSVPGYDQILRHIPVLCDYYSQAKSNIYDLGSSTGAGLLAMNAVAVAKQAKLIGIDNSQAMITSASSKLEILNPAAELELVCADLLDVELENASFVLMNYTLQFIAQTERKHLLTKIFDAMLPNSALVLSEKTQTESSDAKDEMIELHHRFKASKGYSDLEIAQKRDAIEDVLVPESIATHTARLRDVGFDIVMPWQQHFQFASILAVKK